MVGKVDAPRDGRGLDVNVEDVAEVEFCEAGALRLEEVLPRDVEAHADFDIDSDGKGGLDVGLGQERPVRPSQGIGREGGLVQQQMAGIAHALKEVVQEEGILCEAVVKEGLAGQAADGHENGSVPLYCIVDERVEFDELRQAWDCCCCCCHCCSTLFVVQGILFML